MAASARRYTLISSDAHAGASIEGYKPYLVSELHDAFDEWAATFSDPWLEIDSTLEEIGVSDDPNMRVGTSSILASYNWESDQRLEHLNSQGIAAEVLFPNTVPPFYPSGMVTASAPSTAEEYRYRWAGVQAHNRWLVDFCNQAPGRRAGLAQVFLTDIDDAIAEVRWAREAGLMGVLVPSDHTSQLVDLYERRLDPFWAACCELDMPVQRHAIAVTPPRTLASGPTIPAIGVHETNLFFQRGIGHLILGGVFERFPDLKFVFTETASVFISMQVMQMESEFEQGKIKGSTGWPFFHHVVEASSLTPKEYFQRNCWLGASLMTTMDMSIRHQLGVDRIMWGADYPHFEGSYPYTDIALRALFADVPEPEVRAMTSLNAAKVYGFDLDYLQTIADEIGPTVEEVATPVASEEFPEQTMSITIRDAINPIGVV
jgi:predicted TIM-barrel fold metal-dependent hydrolase